MSRLDELLSDAYEVRRFADLPQTHQLAISYYKAVDSDAWDVLRLDECSHSPGPSETPDWALVLQDALPRIIEAYGDSRFGMANVAADALKRAIMNDEELSADFPDWAAYHQWYCASGPVPTHPASNRWPVILSSHDDETLQDGWHRAHSYLRDGHADIPAVFYPEIRHLRAKHASAA